MGSFGSVWVQDIGFGRKNVKFKFLGCSGQKVQI